LSYLRSSSVWNLDASVGDCWPEVAVMVTLLLLLLLLLLMLTRDFTTGHPTRCERAATCLGDDR